MSKFHLIFFGGYKVATWAWASSLHKTAVWTRPDQFVRITEERNREASREMLQAHMISLSMSAFSSPVLWFEKKDASWRLCVDYIALNRVIILYKHPVPVVDDLINELFGRQNYLKNWSQIQISRKLGAWTGYPLTKLEKELRLWRP